MKSLLFLLTCGFAVSLVASEKPVVRVERFVPNGECKVTADKIQILQDRIVGNVVSSRKYELVERENLASVQQELKLVDAGLTEGDAPESNRLKAAGYCIYGKIIQFRNFSRKAQVGDLKVCNVFGTVELQIRIANITTGRTLAAKTVKVEKSRTLSNAVGTDQDLELEVMTDATETAAKEVVNKLNDIAFPVYVLSANNRFVTGNIAAEQVTIGDEWEVFVLGDELKDPKTGEILGQDEELIASVRVSRPGPKTTKFEYGADDTTSEKAKKDILQAKEDGERMLMRLAPKRSNAAHPKRQPSLRDML